MTIRFRGASTAAVVLVCGGTAGGAVLLTVFVLDLPRPFGELVTEPAAWTVPLAFAVMVGVSLATQNRVPADVRQVMFRLHAPEALRVR